jgi:hypothetical protein
VAATTAPLTEALDNGGTDPKDVTVPSEWTIA